MTPGASSTPPVANGQGIPRGRIEAALTGEPLTLGYRPTWPQWTYDTDRMPHIYLLRDVELMLTHPIVRNTLEYYKSGISHAEFWGGEAPDGNPNGQPISDNAEVSAFCLEQVQRFWDRGVPLVQTSYEYGWIGCENCYAENDGKLEWDYLLNFSPRDTYILTQAKVPVGFQVRNVDKSDRDGRQARNSDVNLWFSTPSVPAKGLWYPHQPRYNSHYGQSQLFGAWLPWRRLAWKDGGETVADTGVYRFSFCGPQVGYPEEDTQASSPGPPATTLDSLGNPRRYARDVARQIAEQAKTGCGIGLPTSKYHPDMGGGDKWTLKWPEHVLNVDPVINYLKYLQDQICHGIGVPPELLQAQEIGSGYSGRIIPLEAFLARQQRIADAMLHIFVQQVLAPLVMWNWGPSARFSIKVKDLLQTKRMQQGGEEKGGADNRALPPESGQLPGPEAGLPASRDQGNPLAAAQAQGEAPGMGFSISPSLVTDRVRAITRRILARAA